MDKRMDTARPGYREEISSLSKKNKKRSNKRNGVFGSWMNNVQNNQNTDVVPGMEYQHIMWQSSMQQNFPNNGQRLFTTTSDPSMCGYTPMPMTYAMEPVSLPPMYRVYQPVPFSGIRTMQNRPRRHCNQNHPTSLGLNVNSMPNGYTSLQENGSESPVPINYQNGDYTSLPPTANKNNGVNGDDLNSEHRRYSDPGLASGEAPVHTQSEDSDSIDTESSITTIGRGNKLVLSLIEQMTELKKSNSQLFKELNETKSELDTVKAKLVQCKHNSSSDYQPGMLSDLIHEIREANKACEEGLIAKVKSMVEEKFNQRSSEMEKLNNQILKLTKEKEESDRRIAKLEEEVATLRLNANNEGREIAAFEEETLALRRELQEARALKTLAENHVAKLEKLVDFLRKKMIGATDGETVDKVHDVVASGLSPGVIKAKREGRSCSSGEQVVADEEDDVGQELEEEEDDEDEEDDLDDIDGDKGMETLKNKVPFNPNDHKSTIDNSINLSGPVTDL